MNELTKIEAQPLEVATASEPLSIQQVFQAVLTQKISPENIAVMKQLLAMDAEQQFNRAFTALQMEMPVIVAESIIPNRGKYAKFEYVMRVVSPLLTKHGFSVSFSQPPEMPAGKIVEICHLSHIGGHSRSNTFTVRTGGKSDSETQADCKAATTAKRNALLNCLNIVIRQDALQSEEDASNIGAPIDHAEQQFLRERIAETGANLAGILKMAGAESVETIGKNVYPVLIRALEMKAKK